MMSARQVTALCVVRGGGQLAQDAAGEGRGAGYPALAAAHPDLLVMFWYEWEVRSLADLL